MGEEIDVFKSLKKNDVLRILKEENPPIEGKDNYAQLIVVIECKKTNTKSGIIKVEYYQGEKLEYRGSALLPLSSTSNQGNTWEDLKNNESSFFGFTLDSREPKVHEKVWEFVNRSFDGAVIQDFIPFSGGGSRKSD